MKEFIINNIESIGGVAFVLIIAAVILTNDQWHKTKYEDMFAVILGLVMIAGAFELGAKFAQWLLK